ncbi:MAG TPA: ferrochelatase, partial [Pseudolabrys sp.]|nr:ferrochelatase [Pseudolabrys sp.]
SFHGMPEDYLKKGDPYYCQCAATTRLLRARLGRDESQLMLTFQSRFGTAEWLKPYTIDTVAALAKKGVKNLAVITPGFAADCLETLEEIAMENATAFKSAGGENFAHIPCLNDSERGMAVIRDVVGRELQGWV